MKRRYFWGWSLFLMLMMFIMNISDVQAETIVATNGSSYNSLSEAIEAASDGDTIKIVNDITLSEVLTIDKEITITASEEHSIKGENRLVKLIKVEEGASLTLSGKVVIDGEGMGKNTSGRSYGVTEGIGVIDVAGELTIKDNVEVKNCTIGWASGVINVHGQNATFNLWGGSIHDNTADFSSSSNTNSYGGTIRLYTGATMNMTGGSIKNNKVQGYVVESDGELKEWSLNGLQQSAGIFVNGVSVTVNISGGEITGNESARGSAIYVYGMNGAPEVNISGDVLISNNSCGDYEYYKSDKMIHEAAGAVYVEYWGTVNMSGGTISNNKGYSGGGVTLTSYWLDQEEYVSAKFNMTGGTIEENTATYGGGIYSYSTGVYISGGKIINNTATIGGGIYSEGNATSYGYIHLTNVVIYENTASLEGGGLWLCPTGEASVYVTNGGAIYNNKATFGGDSSGVNSSAAGDDIASGSQSPHFLTLASRALGGSSIKYYVDGGLKTYDGTKYDSWAYPVVDSSVARYGSNTDKEAKTVVNSSEYWALKSEITNATFAESIAKVKIYGNTAQYGGGIGANGGVEIGDKDGDDDLVSVKVAKVWNDEESSNRPDEIVVYLTNEEEIIDSAILSEENDWSYEFVDLPSTFTYSVLEKTIDGYTASYIEVDDGFVITNTLTKVKNPNTNVQDKLIISTITLIIGILVVTLYKFRRKKFL